MPVLKGVDHIHVFVTDRHAAEAWHHRVLGMTRIESLAFWAADPQGPLMIADASQSVCLSLFERPAQPCRSTLAMRVSGEAFRQWRAHLGEQLATPPGLEDHEVAWSLYFKDPDGNPFEITTYEYAMLVDELHAAA
ncbi:VOC family protein [Kushneria phosphatilytica]|uniref:VOC family protein n=1 Tax=Kushneria phosphatilytica TaxID=657387 RepID=A0A5C1A2C8_9GAMM|nr:VOC family protein [Kushneria phosphatilytica]QEL12368.1 VOC family protein [Kushneria phosphatilytica]